MTHLPSPTPSTPDIKSLRQSAPTQLFTPTLIQTRQNMHCPTCTHMGGKPQAVAKAGAAHGAIPAANLPTPHQPPHLGQYMNLALPAWTQAAHFQVHLHPPHLRQPQPPIPPTTIKLTTQPDTAPADPWTKDIQPHWPWVHACEHSEHNCICLLPPKHLPPLNPGDQSEQRNHHQKMLTPLTSAPKAHTLLTPNNHGSTAT